MYYGKESLCLYDDEHMLGKVSIDLNDKIVHDYGPIIDILSKNRNATKLWIRGTYGSYDNTINKFMEKIRLPTNITALRLPYLKKMTYKYKLPPNIEKLTLYRMDHLDKLDFTENTKLKYLKILEPKRAKTYSFNIPKNVIKLYVGSGEFCNIFSSEYCDTFNGFVLPSNIRILKLDCQEHINKIIINENTNLEKIIVLYCHEPAKKIIDLSHIYSLKTVILRSDTNCVFFENIRNRIPEKIKLPYGAVIEF